jgi:methylmalonyl-CoA mutase cobalamin-binding domain/chain
MNYGGGRMTSGPIRVLVAKIGLDGHDRGARVVARCLRDAGMDVIYTGLHRTPTEVVVAAVQEDVDVLGVSLLSGAHLTIIPVLIEELHRAEAGDILVVVGGVIPDEDVRVLLDLGVARVFSQDTQIDAIPNEIRDLVESRTSDL